METNSYSFKLINPLSIKLNYVAGVAFIFFAFLPWVNFGTNSRDTQIWPLLFGLLFLLTSYRHKYDSKEISIASLPLLALVVWFFFSEKVMDFIALRAIISYLAFTVCFLAFTVFVKKYNFPWKLIVLINLLYLIVGILQTYIPNIVSSIVTTRGYDTFGRGVTGLTSEPTFFGIFLFFISYLYLVKTDFKPNFKISLMILLNVISIIFLTKSSTVALFIILAIPILIITRLSFKMLIASFVFLTVSILLIPIFLEGSRLLLLFESAQEIGVVRLIFLDSSINDRVANVIYPLHGFYLNNFLPGGFHSFTNTHAYLTDYYLGFFNYGSGSTSILSYIGVYVYELGFIGVLFLIWIFFLIQDGSFKRFMDTSLLFILLNSSIPPSLPIIPFIFALFLIKNSSSNEDD